MLPLPWKNVSQSLQTFLWFSLKQQSATFAAVCYNLGGRAGHKPGSEFIRWEKEGIRRAWAGPEIRDNNLYFPRPWAVSCCQGPHLSSPLSPGPAKCGVKTEETKTAANVGQRETSTPRSFRYGCFDNCKQTQGIDIRNPCPQLRSLC